MNKFYLIGMIAMTMAACGYPEYTPQAISNFKQADADGVWDFCDKCSGQCVDIQHIASTGTDIVQTRNCKELTESESDCIQDKAKTPKLIKVTWEYSPKCLDELSEDFMYNEVHFPKVIVEEE